MTDFSERQAEAGDSEPPATNMSRRRLLQTSAGVLAVGLGATGSGTAQIGSVPGYADYVPAEVDEIVLQDGSVELASVDLRALFELLIASSDQQEEEGDSEAVRLQFEPQVLGIFSAVTPLSLYEQVGLSDVLPAAAAGSQQSAPEEVPDLMTDRITSLSTTTAGAGAAVATGSYDPGAVGSALDDGPLEPSDTTGVYVGDDPRFGGTQQDVQLAVAWSDQHIITGPSVDLVTTIAATGMGNRPRLHEQNGDLARQLSTAGNGPFTTTSYSPSGTLQINQQNTFFVDYSPLENATLKGYTQSNRTDLAAGEISAVSVFNHPTAGDASESSLSGVGEGADERSASTDGRYVTIEAVYRGEIPAQEDDSSSDDSSSDDSTDDSSSDDSTDDGTDSTDDGTDSTDDSTDDSSSDSDSGSTDGSESESDGSGDDGSASSDDGGPGFGLVSALTGLGGAGYLLKRRTNFGENQA